MFTFRPECCSESQRNGVRLQTGIAFAIDRIPQSCYESYEVPLHITQCLESASSFSRHKPNYAASLHIPLPKHTENSARMPLDFDPSSSASSGWFKAAPVCKAEPGRNHDRRFLASRPSDLSPKCHFRRRRMASLSMEPGRTFETFCGSPLRKYKSSASRFVGGDSSAHGVMKMPRPK